MQIMQQRQNLELSDPESSKMVQTIIGRLDKRDVDRLDAVRNVVIKYKGKLWFLPGKHSQNFGVKTFSR